MRNTRMGLFAGLVGLALGGAVAVGGCAGADDGAVSENQVDFHGAGWFHHPRRDAGSVGTGGGGPTTGGATGGANGSSGAGDSADCVICTQAAACCLAVQATDDGCGFSAATCASMTGPARPAYVNACLTYVVSVRGAWAGNPPAVCR